ncbi:hypothetical protein AAC387_Pa02g2441 [Persea americana]
MPRRLARRIGATAQMTSERGAHASSSTAGRQRPTESERRRRLQQDPLLEPEEENVDSSSDDSLDEEAPPSSPPGEAAEEGDIPGGPANLSVLESFRTHKSYPYGTGRYICILLMF